MFLREKEREKGRETDSQRRFFFVSKEREREGGREGGKERERGREGERERDRQTRHANTEREREKGTHRFGQTGRHDYKEWFILFACVKSIAIASLNTFRGNDHAF